MGACPACGRVSASDSRFCMHCGHSLLSATSAAHVAARQETDRFAAEGISPAGHSDETLDVRLKRRPTGSEIQASAPDASAAARRAFPPIAEFDPSGEWRVRLQAQLNDGTTREKLWRVADGASAEVESATWTEDHAALFTYSNSARTAEEIAASCKRAAQKADLLANIAVQCWSPAQNAWVHSNQAFQSPPRPNVPRNSVTPAAWKGRDQALLVADISASLIAKLASFALIAFGVAAFIWGGTNDARERCLGHRLGDNSFLSTLACAAER